MTDKEKALKVVVKLIKELDDNAIALDVLKSHPQSLGTVGARIILFNMVQDNGYELSTDYKLIPKK